MPKIVQNTHIWSRKSTDAAIALMTSTAMTIRCVGRSGSYR
ncbi:MAG: hypothetical protein ACTIK9_03370 [Agrococcus casei]